MSASAEAPDNVIHVRFPKPTRQKRVKKTQPMWKAIGAITNHLEAYVQKHPELFDAFAPMEIELAAPDGTHVYTLCADRNGTFTIHKG